MSLFRIISNRAIEQIPRRPAVLVTAALMLGIAAYSILPQYPAAWLIALAILLIAAMLAFSRPMTCSVILILAMIIAGIAVAQIEAFFYPRNHISAFATDQPRLAWLELRIDYPPRVLTSAFGDYRALPPKQVFTASLRQLKTWNGWIDCSGNVLVQISQPHPRLEQGQIIRVLCMLERPGPAMNPGQFDWAKYYRDSRVLASVQISHAENISILSQTSIGPLAWLREQARHLLARGFVANQSLDHALLRALVLGDNDPELRDIQEQFRRTGTSHELVVSGLHVAVLGFFVFLICRLLRIRPRLTCWISLLTVVSYGLVVLPSAPVLRSVLLCTCFAIGVLIRRTTDMLQLLAISAAAMLIYHPIDLFSAGFQLSFGVILGLVLFTQPLKKFLFREDADDQLAQIAQSPSRFSVIRRKLKQEIQFTLAASIVAWIVSMPLIAFYFEQLNPWSILAGLLLAPIVIFALIGGFLKIAFTLLWPSFAGFWANLSALPIAAMRHTVGWLAKFPAADIPLPAPPVWAILLFYAFLLSLLVPWPRRWMRWSARAVAILGCITLAILPLREGFVAARSDANDLKITLLAIGAGQTCVVEPPGAQALLVDAGSDSLSDVLRKALGPFLRHEGRREVRTIFISHPNYDHFSAVADVAQAYDVSDVWVSPQFRQQSIGNLPAEHLLQTLDNLDRSPHTVSVGQNFDLGGGAKMEVLWPPADSAFDANNCGEVMRLTFAGRTVLFTADIQVPAEKQLLKSPQLLHADVMVAPHHGSFEWSTVAFVNAVSPQFIVCSNDRTLSGKQRDFDRATRGRAVYRTHLCGAITIRISKDGKISIDRFLNTPDL